MSVFAVSPALKLVTRPRNLSDIDLSTAANGHVGQAPGSSLTALLFALLLFTSPPAASAADATEASLAASVERAKLATVGVLQEGQGGEFQTGRARFSVRGSGFHLRDGYLVTARHVVDRDESGKHVIPKEIRILTADLQELPAALVGVNAFIDIAVYRLAPGTALLPPTTFSDREAAAGDEVFTVGYPLGWGPAISFGRTGNPNTFLPTVESRLLQLDLSACSGNSGGGLFRSDGRLVGMMHAVIQAESSQEDRRCTRFGFAVPGTLIDRIATALIRGGHPEFARIGIQMSLVTVGTHRHVAAADVTGPAQAGGVKKGDVLIAIDDTPITDPAQLKNYLIERAQPGQTVRLKVLRGEAEQTLLVTLGKS
jgi:S1-C subfamily serine protease